MASYLRSQAAATSMRALRQDPVNAIGWVIASYLYSTRYTVKHFWCLFCLPLPVDAKRYQDVGGGVGDHHLQEPVKHAVHQYECGV